MCNPPPPSPGNYLYTHSFLNHALPAGAGLPTTLPPSPSLFSASSNRPFTSFSSVCKLLIYSIAISTVLALLLLCCAAVPVMILPTPVPPVAPLLPASTGPATPPIPLGWGVDEGSKEAISCRALLMRLRRPCSAILWEVRFDVRFVERASG